MPAAQLAFASRWGDININRFFTHVEGHPAIAQVVKEPQQQGNIGATGIRDHSYDRSGPGLMLLARQVPSTGGDNALRFRMKAFASLSKGMRHVAFVAGSALFAPRSVRRASTLYGRDGGRSGNSDAAKQDAVHPVVIRHPLSGRPSLYVNPGFTLRFEGWTDGESAPLLEFLHQHIAGQNTPFAFSGVKVRGLGQPRHLALGGE